MGNVCSSGQKKTDDDTSEKSEDSPSYQLTEKKETKEIKAQADKKEAPLADPEPISDLSTGQNTSLTTNSPTNGNVAKIAQQKASSNAVNFSDSVSSTPLTVNPPCDIPTVSLLPPSLGILQGKPITSRRTENDRKIVIYVLAADDSHRIERTVLHNILPKLNERCRYRGFEIIISDCHGIDSENTESKLLDVRKWSKSPLEAQGGHEEAANCLSEISRHTNFSYVIPVLFLGTSLGTPLLPLTIESQDFTTVLNSAESFIKPLLEKWYLLDNSAQPPCFRLNTKDVLVNPNESNKELNEVLSSLVEIFSKELRDSYLTTVVEQEINNTVLLSQELSKRCIWIQTGCMPPKLSENPSHLEVEMNRRITNIHTELKNQLSEKNLIRIPPTIHVQEEQLVAILESLIISAIDGILEEHSSKFLIPNCTFGVDKRLLNEIEVINQYSKILGQNCANFSIMERLKNYITSDSTAPLIVSGPQGSGKSVLTAKIMHNIHSWLPECSLILRYTQLTGLSSHIVSLLGLIAEQLCILTSGHACRITHTLDSYVNYIKSTLKTTNLQLVIAIDSLDEADGLENTSINWIPTDFPPNVKFIITCSNEENDSTKKGIFLLEKLKKQNIPKENFVEITKFAEEQWRDVLSFGGGDFYAANGALQLPEKWRDAEEKSPLQAKILWWLAWLGNSDISDTKLQSIVDKSFETIEAKVTEEIVSFFLSIMTASKTGIKEFDLTNLFKESKLVKEIQASRLWLKFCWLMGPMLLHSNQITLMDKMISISSTQRYKSKIGDAYRTLYEYFKNQSVKFTDDKGKYECYNVQKLIQLPYLAFMIGIQNKNEETFLTSIYLTDLHWIHDKLVATGCVHILNDIYLAEKYLKSVNSSLENVIHLKILKNFLQTHKHELNYDGDQFYPLFNSYIQNQIKETKDIEKNEVIVNWKECLSNVKTTYLERLNDFILESSETGKAVQSFDIITNLGGKGYFVASINTQKEEICVWDVSVCKKVRTLKGVPQPTSLCPVGEYGAAVLCKREIKVIDLNEGKFKVTLKGVMNQKMPYFGLHDSKHLVCLSRNRMYVNLMNLESGDCVTTFKAGEDRFLNSLLVSGDGRILVCGDETQKPFPLLVWHLSQRKLLYDLRIPHHDFITSLSAITYEGSYVCVVAKELNEPTPNFIVVYDLQSGTLFKKWKPSCNTVSLAISQTNACVIAGLEDARILIWDLVTGNCRCSLIGHNAPVTLLKLDPLGKVLLSGDKEARDLSIRLWELDSGNSLAAYTPPAKISTCEILSNGKYVVLALENHSNLITLQLRNYQKSLEKNTEDDNVTVYGCAENEGKTFEL